MERLTFCLIVLFAVISLSSSALAQDTFPIGAVFGIVFGVFGVGLGVCLPIGIWVCIFCGAAYASRRESRRPVTSFVVAPTNTPRPPPGSYPSQPQPAPVTTAAYPAQPYPSQPATNPAYPSQPATNPAYPTQQDPSYPSAPGYAPSLYPDAPPPYVPPTDEKAPL